MATVRTIKILVVCGVILCTALAAYSIMYYRNNLAYRDDALFATQFLAQAIERESPPDEWYQQLAEEKRSDADQAFYFLKIWFIESGTTLADIRGARIASAKEVPPNGRLILGLQYNDDSSILQCTIDQKNGKRIISPHFPTNNCLYNPDYNGDGIISAADVVLARKRAVQAKQQEAL